MKRRRNFKKAVWGLFLITMSIALFSQEKEQIYDYSNSNNYIVGGVTISGIRFLDMNALVGLSGLKKGQEIDIPGQEIKDAAQKLWQQGLFSDVRITIDSLKADTAFINIYLQERPRLSSLRFNGMKDSESQDITEKINMPIGSQITSYVIENTKKIILDHFIEKGFLNTTVEFVQKDDPNQPNNVILTINVDKKEKVRIGEITFVGNEYFDEKKLRRQMKDTKKKNLNFFKASKFISEKFDDDKQKLITFYNDNGFRDFEIISDSIYKISEDRVGLQIRVDEGDQYFLRNVEWVGNSVYRKEDLDRVFNVKKGSVYNQSLILDRLKGSGGAEDAVSNLYLDYGYLSSQLNPVEA
ncbi:MAG: outer membrane protein assembly factor BamA, partial [Bacteroidales bacterium]|nr:outer membrane protein assembly factor BamA [Bacteroidales bacterium]